MNELFEKLGVDKLRNKYPSALSGGERQRALLIRCITNQMLSLLDEPTCMFTTKAFE